MIQGLRLTPRKEYVGEGDQFKHRPVKILQIQVRFAGVSRFIESEELAQEVNGRYGGSATDLTWIIQFVYDVKQYGSGRPPRCACL